MSRFAEEKKRLSCSYRDMTLCTMSLEAPLPSLTICTAYDQLSSEHCVFIKEDRHVIRQPVFSGPSHELRGASDTHTGTRNTKMAAACSAQPSP